MQNVTAMDVKRLTNEPSAKVRGVLAAKIAAEYRHGGFSSSESQVAADIFRLLLKDVEVSVREAMAQQLCHSPHVPRDIILKLANDETEVAMPILQHSSVLTEEDLVAIVSSTKEVLRLCAIAKRDNVSERLSTSLINKGEEQVFIDLFANKGAMVSPDSLQNAWTQITKSDSALRVLVQRGGLPVSVAEKLLLVVSDDLKHQLSSTYKLGTAFSSKIAGDVREWEVLGLMPSGDAVAMPHSDEQAEELIEQLHASGRLTHSLLIRALCVGCLNVFELGLAKLAHVPRVNARILLMAGGSLGFTAIYKASGMPEGFSDAVQILLRISLEETEYGRLRRMDFCKRVVDRIYLEGYHRTVENMEYLLAITGGRVAAKSSLH
ncbi:MAG: DUF2336 domain-containing protein [Alphaproteobacteria bacterium]|nr:DUF2336 domain-containing protein [Alphaproteobacteria bacterium]